MHILAINGSPRKNWNTGMLLNKVLEGAASQGASTELIHLYDLNYKGCVSCFSCRLKGGASFGKCAVKDDLEIVFKKVYKADGIILGTPIYMGAIAGETQSFLERLLYPLFNVETGTSLFGRYIPTGIIYTMGVTEEQRIQMGYPLRFGDIEMTMKLIFGELESLAVTDTWQFEDYSRYANPLGINIEEKAKRRAEIFPKDCQKAFEMGVRFADSK